MFEINEKYRGFKKSPEYQRLFSQWNRKYFEGRLPPTLVGIAPLLSIKNLEEGAYGYQGWLDNGSPYIVIDKGISEFHVVLAYQTLLHEQIHLFLPPAKKGHGKFFKAEIRRIASLGAFDELI